jgi:hypothetical protein
MLYIQFWAPNDGRRYRLKHVENFTEINKLCNVASCWLYLEIWAPDDGRRYRLKHIEHFTEINQLRNVASCRLHFQIWSPDDGRRYRLKHVEYFTDINKLCNVASWWLYLEIYLWCTDPWTSNFVIAFTFCKDVPGIFPWSNNMFFPTHVSASICPSCVIFNFLLSRQEGYSAAKENHTDARWSRCHYWDDNARAETTFANMSDIMLSLRNSRHIRCGVHVRLSASVNILLVRLTWN